MGTSRETRLSGVELLRIIAMAMVVLVHTDYWALGEPSLDFCRTEFLKASGQYLVESFAIVCVNCFVFISGWFSIRQSVKGFANLLFQILFYSFLLYFSFCAAGIIPFDIKGFIAHSNFFDYWFLACYIALYLLSPILNTFIDNATKVVARSTIWFFIALDLIFGWFVDYLLFDGVFVAAFHGHLSDSEVYQGAWLQVVLTGQEMGYAHLSGYFDSDSSRGDGSGPCGTFTMARQW